MNEPEARYVVSVMVPDRVGIVADVSEAVYRLGGNLEALSQTVMQGWFAMVLSAAFPCDVDAEDIQEAVEAVVGRRVLVSPSALSCEATGQPGPPEDLAAEPFVVTVVGQDRPGIVRRLTRCFADLDINIDDVWNEVREGQFIVIFHVTVPAHVDPKDIRCELDQIAGELEVIVTFQHQDIFAATNSLSVRAERF